MFVTVVLAVFVVFNLDTFSYKASAGVNSGAFERNLAGLELYGLKLPELFLPAWHRWHYLTEFAQQKYYIQTLIKGEVGSGYLGIVGIIGLVWLVVHGLIELGRGTAGHIQTAWWQVIWVSVVFAGRRLESDPGFSGINSFPRHEQVQYCHSDVVTDVSRWGVVKTFPRQVGANRGG